MVEELVEGEQEWTLITSKGEVKTTEYTVHNLKPDVNYFFRVSAVNCAGHGEPLEMTEPAQAKDILGKFIIDIKISIYISNLQGVCDEGHIGYVTLNVFYDFHRGGPDRLGCGHEDTLHCEGW